jgi:ABC-type nickel/cobalt efflux system permease component RcnA
MMGQGIYLVFIVAIVDIANINSIHSSNLELMIECALIAFVIWIILGTFLIYNAQGQMKDWYSMEVYAHDEEQLTKMHNQYEKHY